jgi:hypothetical protein
MAEARVTEVVPFVVAVVVALEPEAPKQRTSDHGIGPQTIKLKGSARTVGDVGESTPRTTPFAFESVVNAVTPVLASCKAPAGPAGFPAPPPPLEEVPQVINCVRVVKLKWFPDMSGQLGSVSQEPSPAELVKKT